MNSNHILQAGLNIAENIPELILQSAAILPDLGSKSGIYLCYQGIEGREWTFKYLNCFERFLRWMGFYSSTHLETIAERLSITPNIPDALRFKIRTSWEQAYPNKYCPLQAPIQIQAQRQIQLPRLPISNTPIAIPPPSYNPDVIPVQAQGQIRLPPPPISNTPIAIPPLPAYNPDVIPAQAPGGLQPPPYNHNPIQQAPIPVQIPLPPPPQRYLPDIPKGSYEILKEMPAVRTLNFTRKNIANPSIVNNVAVDRSIVNGTVFSIEGGDILASAAPCIVNITNGQDLNPHGYRYSWNNTIILGMARAPVMTPNDNYILSHRITDAAGPRLVDLWNQLSTGWFSSKRTSEGKPAITDSANLAQLGIQKIIHISASNSIEAEVTKVLELAAANGLRRIALPPFSTTQLAWNSVYEPSLDEGIVAMVSAIRKYLLAHAGQFDEVKLIFPDHDQELSTRLAWAISVKRNEIDGQRPLQPLPLPPPVHAPAPEIRAVQRGQVRRDPFPELKRQRALMPAPHPDRDQRPPLIEMEEYELQEAMPSLETLNFTRKNAATRTIARNIKGDYSLIHRTIFSIEGGDLLAANVPCIVNVTDGRNLDPKEVTLKTTNAITSFIGLGSRADADSKNFSYSLAHRIREAGGPRLKQAWEQLPKGWFSFRCHSGTPVITSSANLVDRGIQQIIHISDPSELDIHKNYEKAFEELYNEYQKVLELAAANQIRSIALPPFSRTELAWNDENEPSFFEGVQIAIASIQNYLAAHPNQFDEVKLIFPDHDEVSAHRLAWANSIAGQMAR